MPLHIDLHCTLKILIVKLSSLGDVVHAMPAVQDIRRALPHAQIDWVVERSFAPLVRRCEGVHRVIACNLRRWCHDRHLSDTCRELGAFFADLKQDTYDAVIDLQGLTKSAWVSWLARLSTTGKRYGLANQTEGSSFEAPARWVAHVAIQMPPHIDVIWRSRRLCAQALGYSPPGVSSFLSFGLQTFDLQAHDAVHSIDGKPHRRKVVACVFGTSRADKKWPLAYWHTLGRRLNDAGYFVALPHGTDAETAVASDIAQGVPHAQVWARLELDALADALAGCEGVIGVDSGLSHIAVALGLPHVQIYNFDTAWRTGPPPAHAHRQCSVFDRPCPAPDTVWQAWLSVSKSFSTSASQSV